MQTGVGKSGHSITPGDGSKSGANGTSVMQPRRWIGL